MSVLLCGFSVLRLSMLYLWSIYIIRIRFLFQSSRERNKTGLSNLNSYKGTRKLELAVTHAQASLVPLLRSYTRKNILHRS